VSDIEAIGDTSHLPDGLLDSLLPGPVTVVLNRSRKLNGALNPGNANVAVRVPDDLFIRSVAKVFDGPIALTSANTSSQPSTLNVEEFKHMWPLLGAVFEGGTMEGSRKGSTVVDLSVPYHYSILREGSALSATVLKLTSYGIVNSNIK